MDRLGHYHILDLLGAGGMGQVYLARDTRLGRMVAIKVLPEAIVDDRDRRERLLLEARASAALSHPNICALFEVGGDEARPYLVFEYVPGDTLRQALDKRAVSLRAAIDIGAQLASALADAHAAGIVHRDIKPENIIVSPRGHPKILDFGLAAFTTSGASRDSTVTEMKTAPGVVLGTLQYMSPEQALGASCDHRTDIFSLGVVLYELITGTSPFKAPTAAATSIQIVQAEPALPSTINARVPPELDAIVMRALAKDPGQRHQSGATLADDLRRVGAGLDVPETRKVEVPARAPRPRWKYAAATLGAVATIAVAWWASGWNTPWGGTSPPPLVAVLPLEIIGDTSRAYFADGLTEDMIARLGQLPGVKVLGRSSTRDYRGRAPSDVARELRAAVVLTGAVQSDGDEVKVTVSLIDPKDGSQIWSDSYQRPLTNIFAVQNAIAEDVARHLRVTLAPSPVRARTAARRVSVAAYDVYLRARDAAARRDVDRAVELYRQAVAADPGLVEALAGLGEALHLRLVRQGMTDPSIAGEMRRVALAAAAAEPDLPQTELALALTDPVLTEALGHFRRAIALDPSYAEAYHQAGDYLMELAPDQALALYRRSLALDPRAVVAHGDMAAVLSGEGRFAEAAVEASLYPTAAPNNVVSVARIAAHRGHRDEAIKVLRSLSSEQLEPNPTGGFSLGPMLLVASMAVTGQRAEALALASATATRVSTDCQAKVMLAALMYDSGQRPAAVDLVGPLLAAAQAPQPSLPAIRCGPMAAAAIGDASTAAAMLRSIAADDVRLRYWTIQVGSFTAHEWLKRAWYPFNRIGESAEVLAAQQDLARAFSRVRAAVDTTFADVDFAAEASAAPRPRLPSTRGR